MVHNQEDVCGNDVLSLDSSSNSTPSSRCCNEPGDLNHNDYKHGGMFPLSSELDWDQNSLRQKFISYNSPRTESPPSKKPFTPSKSCISRALLGVVFVDEEIVFESISDSGSNYPYTPGKSLNDAFSLRDESSFCHRIPVTPSNDVEEQQTKSRSGVFFFCQP
jgi:hypothetical protein